MKLINQRWFAVLIPAIVGFGLAVLSVEYFETYGWSLFLVLPAVVGFLSSSCLTYQRTRSFSDAYWTSVLSLLVLGGLILLVALDGLICLLMAFPLAMVIALLGVALGMNPGKGDETRTLSLTPFLVVALFPAVVAVDLKTKPQGPIRSVTTRVVVQAPIQRVWQTVIAFPKITEPPAGIFCCGIAYPIEARIEGTGVGAVRHCVFSTGAFVEPITHWEEPHRLAFDVLESPAPMREISFHEHVDAPHLHGHMVSHRGEFRLIEENGQVVLEGTTWYSHTLAPQWYWGPISDYLIHRIHERVLNHIKRTCEAP